MKLHVATLTSFPWNVELANEFRRLASLDRFRQHSLTDVPEEADGILIVDLHQHHDDWQHLLDNYFLTQRFPRKILVYDERDLPWCKWPGVYVSMPSNDFEQTRQRAYSYAHLKNAFPSSPTCKPDLLYSFQGANSHPVRAEVLTLRHPRAVVEDPRFNFFEFSDLAGTRAYQSQAQQHKDRYQEIVSRSKFVLCPRGMGTSSFRLYEVLSAGRVPVIISDAWVPPVGPDWAACSIRVPQAEIRELSRILERHEDEYGSLAAAAARTYRDWFAPEAMFHRLAEQCADLLQHGRMGRKPLYFFNRLYLRHILRSGKSWLRQQMPALGMLRRTLAP